MWEYPQGGSNHFPQVAKSQARYANRPGVVNGILLPWALIAQEPAQDRDTRLRFWANESKRMRRHKAKVPVLMAKQLRQRGHGRISRWRFKTDPIPPGKYFVDLFAVRSSTPE